MNSVSLHELVPILQLAIGPVILISGVGLLLLTLTNRFGRMIDRVRLLTRERAGQTDPVARAKLDAQIAILERRAGLLRLSISLGATTVLLVPVLILVLFLSSLLRLELGALVIVIFCVSQVTLFGAMLTFIQDMNLSLKAMRLEIER